MLRRFTTHTRLSFVLAAISTFGLFLYLNIQDNLDIVDKQKVKISRRRLPLALLKCPTTFNNHSSQRLSLSVRRIDKNKQNVPSECRCTDNDGQAYDFCYHLPEQRSIFGKRFSCEHLSKIKDLGLLNPSSLKFTGDEVPSVPVFVTAFSDNHAHEASNLVATIDRYFDKKRLIAYDLGDVSTDSFKEYKFMEFRRFCFEDYPAYVKDLGTFRWKPIIIAETLKEFGAIWYMDSSVIFKKGNLSHVYELVRCRKYISKRPRLKSVKERDIREAKTPHEDGWDIKQWKENVAECRKAAYLLHGYTGHGIYTATSQEIYKYFPTNFTEIKKPKAKMYEAGMVFVVRTKDTVEDILKWYVLCALEEGCMAGNGQESPACFFGSDRFAAPPTCHRYDQSVVNLLAANAFWYDRHYYVSEIVDFFNIVRQ